MLWTYLSLNIFAHISRINMGFSEINGENPVKIGCIPVVSEKSVQKSVHRISVYTIIAVALTFFRNFRNYFAEKKRKTDFVLIL